MISVNVHSTGMPHDQCEPPQAHDLFLNFFPEPESQRTSKLSKSTEKQTVPHTERLQLADAFGSVVPEGKYSVAALQGFLMSFKGQPERAVQRFLNGMG